MSLAIRRLSRGPTRLTLAVHCHYSTVGEVAPDVQSAILLQSKAFDPKLFLRTIHPSATPEDLRRGRERLTGG